MTTVQIQFCFNMTFKTNPFCYINFPAGQLWFGDFCLRYHLQSDLRNSLYRHTGFIS